jgi:cytochrome c oxidase subunit IV
MTPETAAPVRTYARVFAALVLLAALTTGIAYLDLGALNVVASLAIATTKAALVVFYFMHLRASSRITWIFAGAGFFWLLILLALSLGDVLTRGWFPSPQLNP